MVVADPAKGDAGAVEDAIEAAWQLQRSAEWASWSGRRESNPHYQLGRLKFCH
jgi:predicted transposase YbfD/YdcC